MGNYCCSQQDYHPHHPLKLRRKVSLTDPHYKKNYQRKISQVINRALNKFKEEKKVSEISFISEIGRGGQGDVLLVEVSFEDKYNDFYTKQYAMKRVPKTKLSLQRTRKALILENQILSSHCSDFLVNIQYAFQDDTFLYYLMEIAKGGDAYGYIYPSRVKEDSKVSALQNLGEYGIKFILAGVILGLEYLREQDIIYGDLKPENILLYDDGYPKLADFGIINRCQQNTLCYDMKGTVIYFSPQMVLKKGYDRGHDLWTIGILLYQFIFKNVPFSENTIESSRYIEQIQKWHKSPQFDKKSPSNEAVDLIKSLLKVDPKDRIGYESIEDIKKHPFFSEFQWEKYERKQLKSPLAEIVQSNPLRYRPLSEDQKEITECYKQLKIPFTFVREESTDSPSLQKTSSEGEGDSL